MKIVCTNCNHTEKTDKDFFVKLIGGAMPIGGFWAWTTYLFAGTGFAMAIVVAIIGGGVAMLIFKDEIVEWIINKDYKCPECGQVDWKAEDGVATRKDELSLSKKASELKVYDYLNAAEKLLFDGSDEVQGMSAEDAERQMYNYLLGELSRKSLLLPPYSPDQLPAEQLFAHQLWSDMDTKEMSYEDQGLSVEDAELFTYRYLKHELIIESPKDVGGLIMDILTQNGNFDWLE